MENKDLKKEVVNLKENNNEKNATEKFQVNFKPKKDFTLDVLDFYNDKLKKLHIILTVILVVVYILSFFSKFLAINNGSFIVLEDTVAKNFSTMVRESFVFDVVVAIAGITPYCFLSVIGIGQIFALVRTLAIRRFFNESLMITCFIGGLFQVIGITMCIAVGLYYCVLTTKKNKYYHHLDFGINDLKLNFYQLRKNDKKVEEIKKDKIKKAKKIEACNIKIPYIQFATLLFIAFVIQVIGIVITLI